MRDGTLRIGASGSTPRTLLFAYPVNANPLPWQNDPGLLVYPLDLNGMDYETYKQIYQDSVQYLGTLRSAIGDTPALIAPRIPLPPTCFWQQMDAAARQAKRSEFAAMLKARLKKRLLGSQTGSLLVPVPDLKEGWTAPLIRNLRWQPPKILKAESKDTPPASPRRTPPRDAISLSQTFDERRGGGTGSGRDRVCGDSGLIKTAGPGKRMVRSASTWDEANPPVKRRLNALDIPPKLGQSRNNNYERPARGR